MEIMKYLNKATFDFNVNELEEYEHENAFIEIFSKFFNIFLNTSENQVTISIKTKAKIQFNSKAVDRIEGSLYFLDQNYFFYNVKNIAKAIYHSDNDSVVVNIHATFSIFISMDPVYFSMQRMSPL